MPTEYTNGLGLRSARKLQDKKLSIREQQREDEWRAQWERYKKAMDEAGPPCPAELDDPTIDEAVKINIYWDWQEKKLEQRPTEFLQRHKEWMEDYRSKATKEEQEADAIEAIRAFDEYCEEFERERGYPLPCSE